MTLEGRAADMARSLDVAARGSGLDEAEGAWLQRAHALAMEPRIERLSDDHHPAYLHPGRSPLILLGDVGAVDVVVLVIACVHESTDEDLRVPRADLAESLGASVLGALDSIPVPGDERLIERLITLGPGTALVALAERLDHLRHLHLREDLMDTWADMHAEVLGAWLPFSQRTHPKLATRYAHWARTFVKRI